MQDHTNDPVWKQAIAGSQMLLVAFGGGLSWAACTMKWWAGAPSLRADSGKQAPEQPAPGQVSA